MTATARGADGALRVALIGYGLAGSAFHAPLIAVTRGLRLRAIVTRDPQRAAAARRDHPGVEIVERADDVWARATDYDIAVVATPNRTHAPLALAALGAGLHVVVDKPFAATSADAQRVVDEAGRRARIVTVYQNRRWDGDFLTLRRLLAERALGEVARFESRFDRWRPAPKPGWREETDPAAAGGTLYDLGSHLIDQALVLFGAVTHVYAELDRRRSGAAVDDDVFVALTHASGVRSHLHMTALAAIPTPRFRLHGTAGAYVKHGFDVQEAALRAGKRPDSHTWGEEPREHWGTISHGQEARAVGTERGAYQQFYERLVAAVRDGEPPPVDPRDAVATLAVIEAAQRSARERRVVAL